MCARPFWVLCTSLPSGDIIVYEVFLRQPAYTPRLSLFYSIHSISFNQHSNIMDGLYRYRKRGPEWFGHLPKVTWLVGGRVGCQSKVSLFPLLTTSHPFPGSLPSNFGTCCYSAGCLLRLTSPHPLSTAALFFCVLTRVSMERNSARCYMNTSCRRTPLSYPQICAVQGIQAG